MAFAILFFIDPVWSFGNIGMKPNHDQPALIQPTDWKIAVLERNKQALDFGLAALCRILMGDLRA